MNNTFHINRFGKLIKQQCSLSGKSLGLALSSIFVGYTIILLIFTFNHSYITTAEWTPFFVILNTAIALPFAAYAFPAFRTKERTFDYLLLPCSATEKFIFSLIIRIIAPWIVLPIIFYISSLLSEELALWYYPYSTIESFSLTAIIELFDGRTLLVASAVFTILIIQSVLFAGATTFSKHPLIKTLLTLGIAGAVIIFYFYILSNWVGLFDNGRQPWLAQYSNNTTGAYAAMGVELVIIITSWAYAFFKVKEKEIA